MQLTQSLHTAAETYPTVLATVFNGRQQTWAELKAKVSKLAAGIKSLGGCANEPVAILALNTDRYTEYYYGVWWAGCTVVPMNTRWSATENAYSLNDSGAKMLFIDDAFLTVLPEILAQADNDIKIIYIGENACPEGMTDYASLISKCDPCHDARHGGEDLAGIYYTGGTTGFPKGVMLPHRALWYNGLASAKHFNFEPGDSYLHAAPMFHLADGAGGCGASAVGATHHYLSAFTPDGVLDVIAEHKITHSLLVPTMIQMVLQSPNFKSDKLSSMKYLVYGASPMPQGVLLEALDKLSHIGLIQGYGQTEMAPLMTTLAVEYHVLEGAKQGKLSSAGRPVIGTMLRIIGEDGCDVPRGQVGEIVAYGPGAMLGYWKRPEETAATLVNGGVHTGDGAYMDDDGFVFIVDRVKDMIVSGGENVFSAEVENAISTHPSVAGVAVIGIPSEKWGEAVHAIIIPKEGCEIDAADIKTYCKTYIANYKCPSSIEVRTEPFPLSGAGKVMKKNLRAPYWKDKSRGVG